MRAAYLDGHETATARRPRMNPFAALDADRKTPLLARMLQLGHAAGDPVLLRADVR